MSGVLSESKDAYQQVIEFHRDFNKRRDDETGAVVQAFVVDSHLATHSHDFFVALKFFADSVGSEATYLSVDDDVYMAFLQETFGCVPLTIIEANSASATYYDAFRSSPAKKSDVETWAIMPFMGMDGTFLIQESRLWELQFTHSQDECVMLIRDDLMNLCHACFNRIGGLVFSRKSTGHP